MLIKCDVLTILGPGREVDSRVLSALEKQGKSINLKHCTHRGGRLQNESKMETIARSRNEAKALISAPYTLLLDDDIVLPPLGIEKLLGALIFNPHYAAIAISCQKVVSLHSSHVAMSATLFYSSILKQITFRSENGKCECLSGCDDIRKKGYLIEYLPSLRAIHLDGNNNATNTNDRDS